MGTLVGRLLVQYCDMELRKARGGRSFFGVILRHSTLQTLYFVVQAIFAYVLPAPEKTLYVSDLIVEYSYDILILSICTLFTSEPRSSSRSPNAEAIDRSTPILPNTLANIVSCPITIFKRCVVEFSPTNMIRRRTKTLIV